MNLVTHQLNLFHFFLSERRFRNKVNSEYSDWEDLLTGFPQASVLGPL